MTTAAAVAHSQLADFVELTKPRVVLMVLLTTMVGFYLGAIGPLDMVLLGSTVLGTALAAAGTLALNQFIERDLDARMDRTRRRPLPDRRAGSIRRRRWASAW
jgi:protoheme IX farnesyltransferase